MAAVPAYGHATREPPVAGLPEPSPTGTPRPMRSRVTADDGRSPGLRVPARRRLPGFHPSGRLTLRSPLTVAGAAAAFGCRPSPRSLLIPSGEPSPEPCHSKFFASTRVKAWLQPIIPMTAQDRLTLLTRRQVSAQTCRYAGVQQMRKIAPKLSLVGGSRNGEECPPYKPFALLVGIAGPRRPRLGQAAHARRRRAPRLELPLALVKVFPKRD
jgi:hypothetical protein